METTVSGRRVSSGTKVDYVPPIRKKERIIKEFPNTAMDTGLI